MSLITFGNKVDTVSNPSPDINKVQASDINALKNGINYFYDLGGYVIYTDSVHTEGDPQVLTASTDNDITIVDASPNKTQAPNDLGSDELWTANKITPITVGDAYLVRFEFNAKIANSAGWFDMKIDINGLIGDIFTQVQTFPKGADTEHGFSVTNLIYTLDTFKANGGTIQINPSHEMEIYDKVVTIHRVYKGKELAV